MCFESRGRGRWRPAGRGLATPGLDNRLTDCDDVVNPKNRSRSTPQKHYFSASGTYLC
jgi:hypothetical protein